MKKFAFFAVLLTMMCCCKKTNWQKDYVWTGIENHAACTYPHEDRTTCVSDGVVYDCIVNEYKKLISCGRSCKP